MKTTFTRFIADDGGSVTIPMMVIIATGIVIVAALFNLLGPTVFNKTTTDMNNMQINANP